MTKIFLLAVSLVLVATAMAQAQLQAFLPSDCLTQARDNARGTAPDAELIGIVTPGLALTVPVGGFNLSVRLGMRLNDGRSEGWAYAFRSASRDTVILVPMVRAFVCVPAPVPGSDEFGAFFTPTALPPSTLQGTPLLRALETDAAYRSYRQAYPDSVPNIAALSTSAIETPGFPVGTPFWFFQFFGRNESENMTCFVHAVEGTTNCVSVPLSVVEATRSGAVALSPNPSQDVVLVHLPDHWNGKNVTIVIADVSGSILARHIVQADVPSVLLPTRDLPSGGYNVVVHCDGQYRTERLVVVH
ncbi:MAG: T9SS type A sorting domain-containing protein [Candidatus Kapabacteria bacterium]|jgi:hypothetical protein|nr:T9SS type A sorting domain-containing protein [Candidatus Kapabacteria bacterium]